MRAPLFTLANLKLEQELQTKLKHSRITKTRNRSKQSFVCDRSAHAQVAEVCVIENIERLRTELNRGVLTETEVLGQREIHARRRWTINSASRSISRHVQYTGSSSRSLLGKTGSVEPLVDSVRCVVVRIT